MKLWALTNSNSDLRGFIYTGLELLRLRRMNYGQDSPLDRLIARKIVSSLDISLCNNLLHLKHHYTSRRFLIHALVY